MTWMANKPVGTFRIWAHDRWFNVSPPPMRKSSYWRSKRTEIPYFTFIGEITHSSRLGNTFDRGDDIHEVTTATENHRRRLSLLRDCFELRDRSVAYLQLDRLYDESSQLDYRREEEWLLNVLDWSVDGCTIDSCFTFGEYSRKVILIMTIQWLEQTERKKEKKARIHNKTTGEMQ